MGVPVIEVICHQTPSSITFLSSRTYEFPTLILFNTQYAQQEVNLYKHTWAEEGHVPVCNMLMMEQG